MIRNGDEEVSDSGLKWKDSTVTHERINELIEEAYLTPLDMACSRALDAGSGNIPRSILESQEKSAPPPLFSMASSSLSIHFQGLASSLWPSTPRLSPNSIIHVSCYITLHESFLCCEPHFGLRRKVFRINQRSSRGTIVEVGNTIIGKALNVPYLNGSVI